jgi:trehalose 6-phosphate phosphatase
MGQSGLPPSIAAVARRPAVGAILLDVDGTLSPIVATPRQAALQPGAREALAELVRRYAVVGAISGRPATQVDDLIRVAGVRISGVHGLEGRPPAPPDLLRAARSLAAREAGAVVESKGAAIAVHYRATADPDAAGRRLEAELLPVAAEHGLELVGGKRVWELVPAGTGRKAEAVRELVAESRATAVLYAGDDVGDLTAFDALDELARDGCVVARVAVGGDAAPAELIARADVVVDGPAAVVDLLKRL